MAGDWIKIEHATIDKPEIYQMAEILDLDPHHILGSIISVWVWMDKQLESCNANRVTKKLLDRKADVTGFADAMLQVGWLSECDSGFEVPNFERHLGNSAKKRAETARRVTKYRQKCNTKNVTPSVTNALTREEKRREDINTNNAVLEFDAIWNEYGRRGSKKKGLERYLKLSDKDRDMIKNHYPSYVASRELKYRKYIEAYISDRLFESEVEHTPTKEEQQAKLEQEAEFWR